MRKLFPKEDSFFPQTLALPGDLGVLKAHLRAKKRAVFICKPKNSAMGKGIFLTRRPLRVLKESVYFNSVPGFSTFYIIKFKNQLLEF